LSDPVDRKFLLLTTTDGAHWAEMPGDGMPAALAGEGAFAASNSCLLLYGKSEVYFATGGGPKARVFHSTDLGKTWTVSETPILSGKNSQGIFSIVRAGDTVVVMGGDYADAAQIERSAAYSNDQGQTWDLAPQSPAGFRSAVDTYDFGFVAVGPNGANISRDGMHWKGIDAPSLNALTFDSGKGWAVGNGGVIARFIDHNEEEEKAAVECFSSMCTRRELTEEFRRRDGLQCYGAVCVGKAFGPDCENSKRINHSLGMLWPFASGELNSHWRAATSARSAKYLLGPGAKSSASDTRPTGSTLARTVTRTVP
jgi:photosystem II stability/assembly factor-like uncharacterized protein